MKKIFSLIAIFAIAFVQQGFAQDSSKSVLLNSYYDLKDALVKGNSNAASAGATELVKNITGLENSAAVEESRAALIKDATAISVTKDIKIQRQRFASLSANMLILAKRGKLSTGPVYQQYCPMQNASWLSNSKTIKNPYYGNAMLSCGSVKATL